MKNTLQKAVKEEALTREYKANATQLVQELNELCSTAITSYLQYKQHACIAFPLFPPGLKDEFTSHATQELEHADVLAERMQKLGGGSIFDLEKIADKTRQAEVKIKQGRSLEGLIGENFMLNVSRSSTMPHWPEKFRVRTL